MRETGLDSYSTKYWYHLWNVFKLGWASATLGMSVNRLSLNVV